MRNTIFYYLWLSGGYLGTPHTSDIPLVFSTVIMRWPHHPVCHSPSQMLATIMSWAPINYSFYACFTFGTWKYAPLHPSKPTRTLLNSLLPPFHDCATCMFFREFPGHTCTQNLTLPAHHAYVCLVFVLPRASMSQRTHANPTAPIRTCLHPSKPYITCVLKTHVFMW